MAEPFVDLRSDTVTRPTPAMRRAMAEAEVGDDVYGEDPTVRRLEERAAALVDKEAALFVPTGTMGNQIAVQLHSPRGTDVLLDEGSHVYLYELGAMAAWAGAFPRVLRGERGMLDAAQVAAAVAPDEYDVARTSLVLVENTHNSGGGTVTPLARQRALLAVARERGVAAHLDGARLFNAAAALDCSAADVASGFDTVMFCLSKGLGAPVGSVLCGSVAHIREARVLRKRMGGGMRQVGILAAAGLHALDHHVARLGEDHRRAGRLAEAVSRSPAFRLDPATVETNIVIAEVREPSERDRLLSRLQADGVLAGAMGPGRIRFVTHLDVDDAGLERAMDAVQRLPARAGVP